MKENTTYDALVLFSAGLDSLLTAKVLMKQGLRVKCLHFVTPFFGHPGHVKGWEKTYGLDIDIIDVGNAYVDMMRKGPKYGFGKLFNPCVDCKILMLSTAKKLLKKYGASFIATGEVVGQRPMSQRPDALNSIRNDSETEGFLLRPLSAKHLPPTPMEESGLVDREQLYGFYGRGRKDQMALVRELGVREEDIPTPAGGCRLTESPSACRYAPIFEHYPDATDQDFYLANVGRQYWAGTHWLSIGRDKISNEMIERNIRPTDYVFQLKDYPGPLVLGRPFAGEWSEEALRDAAAMTAYFSPRARRAGTETPVILRQGDEERELSVLPSKENSTGFHENVWKDVKYVRNGMDLHHTR